MVGWLGNFQKPNFSLLPHPLVQVEVVMYGKERRCENLVWRGARREGDVPETFIWARVQSMKIVGKAVSFICLSYWVDLLPMKGIGYQCIVSLHCWKEFEFDKF